MNKKINFGIVGLGHIGKKHISCISENESCNLVGLCDKRSFKSLYLDNLTLNDNSVFYTSLDQMLFDENIDVVSICTPNYLHASMAIKCLSNNKHVIIEKPMALSSHDAELIMTKSNPLLCKRSK